jgi:calcineurin-like phosphoesterase family protein
MEIFLTSDTHFGHRSVIDFCNRPYSSVEEMNEDMVERWNEVVTPEDMVFHLGDVLWPTGGNKEFLPHTVLGRLNGRIILIRGNHDTWMTRRFETENFHAVHDQYVLGLKGRGYKGQKLHIHMLHYPLRTWYRREHGGLHAFGHVHGNYEEFRIEGTLDVGVDTNNYRPITIDEYLEKVSAESYWMSRQLAS